MPTKNTKTVPLKKKTDDAPEAKIPPLVQRAQAFAVEMRKCGASCVVGVEIDGEGNYNNAFALHNTDTTRAMRIASRLPLRLRGTTTASTTPDG